MFKMITLIRRRPGMSKEAFRDHYERVHMPLSHTLFPEVASCTRNYPQTENLHYIGAGGNPSVPFDVVTEHLFADRAAYERTMASFANDPEKARLLAEDEEAFCDEQSMIMFLVDCESSSGQAAATA